jgi:hypothetical protein
MGNLVEKNFARKGRGKSLMSPQRKLLRKMPLMERKVPSAAIVGNMGT